MHELIIPEPEGESPIFNIDPLPLPEALAHLAPHISSYWVTPEGRVIMYFPDNGLGVYNPAEFVDGTSPPEELQNTISYRWPDGTYHSHQL